MNRACVNLVERRGDIGCFRGCACLVIEASMAELVRQRLGAVTILATNVPSDFPATVITNMPGNPFRSVLEAGYKRSPRNQPTSAAVSFRQYHVEFAQELLW